MGFLRWPIVLVLGLLSALSLAPAVAVAIVHASAGALSGISPSLGALEETARAASWIEAGLWLAAGLALLVATVRLIRGTQAFWAWLIGFVFYSARWAFTQEDAGGVVETFRSLSLSSVAAGDAAGSQVSLLALHPIIGLAVLLVDAGDRAR
jgi:hypothetical protein